MKTSTKRDEVAYDASLEYQGSVCCKWGAIHCSRWRS